MEDLATILRAAQLAAHEKHHTVKGPSFFEDHEFLGNLYGTYEGLYDDTIEKMIGLKQTADIPKITTEAAKVAVTLSKRFPNVSRWFDMVLSIEDSIRTEIFSILEAGASNGVQNFLQGIADASEKRTYLVRQRSL